MLKTLEQKTNTINMGSCGRNLDPARSSAGFMKKMCKDNVKLKIAAAKKLQ